MFFLKKTLTFSLAIVFTQAFSQAIVEEKTQATFGDNSVIQDSNLELAFAGQQKVAMHTTLDSDLDNSLNGSTSSLESDNEENTADIVFLGPAADTKYKRGNAIQVRWTGGNPDDEYALDLFDGRFHYRHIGELKNSGTYPWIIPKDVDPGKEYRFKLTNTNDFGEFAFSKTFIIKRRVPIVAWIVPGAIVVGGVLFLILYDDSPAVVPDLPAPIEPN